MALLVLASSLLVTTPASAQGPVRDFASEAGFHASLNQQRANVGLPPLVLNGSMTAAADSWALAMANGSFLAHASDIISGTPGGWTKVGENVGRGQTVTSLTSAFMNSPGHRANVLDASYTHIGIAVYTHPSDGRIYTTHRFAALPGGGAPAPVAPVAPTAVPVVIATPVPPTPVPATPVPATPVPATAVPVAPTAAPTVIATPISVAPTPEPTATPVPPTLVPATPVPTATAVPATPVPTATSVPPTPIPATPVPATPVPVATVAPTPDAPQLASDSAVDQSESFGAPPQELAFINVEAAVEAKRSSKTAKFDNRS